MSNTEIPDDITRTAQSVWVRLSNQRADGVYTDPVRTIATALMAERDRCAQYAEAWSRPDALRLAAGEMTAQEMRTATAVARGIVAAIRQP